MTEQENEVFDLLVSAHNKYMQLPVQHPDDHSEWVLSLHRLQEKIMIRKTVRECSGFLNISPCAPAADSEKD